MSAAFPAESADPDAAMCSAAYQVNLLLDSRLRCRLLACPTCGRALQEGCLPKTFPPSAGNKTTMWQSTTVASTCTRVICSMLRACTFQVLPQYWPLPQVHAFRQRVLFTEAAGQIPKNAVVLEVGPHSVLRSPLRQCRPDLPYVAAMKRGADGAETVPASVCELWRKGASLHWPAAPVTEEDSAAPERAPSPSQALTESMPPLPDRRAVAGKPLDKKCLFLPCHTHAKSRKRLSPPAMSSRLPCW